jgi:signal transduction histidine kinase
LNSNAIKFTNKGSVKIIVRVVPPPTNLVKAKCNEQDCGDVWVSLENLSLQESSHLKKPLSCNPPAYDRREPDPQQTAMTVETSKDRHEESSSASTALETVESTRETIWLQCEVCDTGIGIPGINPDTPEHLGRNPETKFYPFLLATKSRHTIHCSKVIKQPVHTS